MQTNKQPAPTLDEEMALFEQGYSFIAGVDEAGRGCLAGPVVAAAVILPLGVHELASHLAGVRDSKQMTAQARDRLYDVIMLHALATGVGMGSVELIDERNILQATKHAMYAAIAQLSVPVQALLSDERCLSIAAASIVAKVTRDRLMLQLHEQYPLYGFNQNKGYGTPAHLAALHEHGVTPLHRKSFAPVRELIFGLFTAP
ncbi:MAG: ribonuclease HII [Chloroflexi bacterium]|nr:MAG: ribonuclease HII [Chloroflexota bacterium]